MVEYCSVTYAWLGRGLTQEIGELRIQAADSFEWQDRSAEWRGKYWTHFLNFMARKNWELVSIVPLRHQKSDAGLNTTASLTYPLPNVVAYFKRLAE